MFEITQHIVAQCSYSFHKHSPTMSPISLAGLIINASITLDHHCDFFSYDRFIEKKKTQKLLKVRHIRDREEVTCDAQGGRRLGSKALFSSQNALHVWRNSKWRKTAEEEHHHYKTLHLCLQIIFKLYGTKCD